MFKVSTDKNKRIGIITTKHGDIKTPAFLPDATYGAVKTLTWDDVLESGIDQILCTTLHLHLNPGDKYIKRMGGLHAFLGWNRPILTDSGGWQVFSLINNSGKGKVTEQGAEFVLSDTGQEQMLTPEDSINIQANLKSDIFVVLDNPVLGSSLKKNNEKAVKITTLWARRAKDEFLKRYQLNEEKFDNPKKYKRPLLFCVVQGGDYKDLRKKSAEELQAIGFDGFGYGGILEKDNKMTKQMLKFFSEIISKEKIRYGMGVGRPEDIQYCLKRGYDLFDSVVPTRNARHGLCYTSFGAINIKRSKYRYDNRPIDRNCDCPACTPKDRGIKISRAYLRHLFKIKESAGFTISTKHNLYYFSKIFKKQIIS